MSFVGLKLNHEVARLLSSIDLSGEKVSTDQMHVTILYLGDETPMEEIAQAILAIFKVTQNQDPFKIKISKVDTFASESDVVPVICPIISDQLHDLRKKLASSFDKSKISYSKKFKEYKPHVTLAYSDEKVKSFTLDKAIESHIYELVLWAGDNGDDRMCATFPFKEGKITKKAVYSAISKLPIK